MQDIIPISADDRRFTIRNWIGFVIPVICLTPAFAALILLSLVLTWIDVLNRDFTVTDVVWSSFWTIILVPTLLLGFGAAMWADCVEPYLRSSVLLDRQTGQLVLKTHHLTGLSFRRTLALDDVRDFEVTWGKSEDGRDFPYLQLFLTRRSVRHAITNPADVADRPAFSARLRAELGQAGWSAGAACGCPQAEPASADC